MRPPLPYGGALLRRDDDGTVHVVHADEVIGVTDELLGHLGRPPNLLVLDTAGTYRYHLIGYYADPAGWGVQLYRREVTQPAT